MVHFRGGRSPSKRLQEIMPLGSKSPARDYIAVVTKPIPPNGYGQVKWHGLYWTAFCEEEHTFALDALVRVVDTSGNKLAVEPHFSEV